MGRPLKIAKATLLTITDTATSGSVVTVTQNLTTQPTVGISAGMSFTVTTNVGGLTAGTIYYINQILSNTTFSVSATQLSVQPQVMATLSNTTGQSVTATVGVVDSGFNNPNNSNTSAPTGSNESFGVVGGNTGIVGPQILANVAIGVSGAGTITVADDDTEINGTGTDFSNTFISGTKIYLTDGTYLGTIDTITSATVADFVSNSTANATDAGYVYATAEAGYILRQKGKTKYLVQGTTTGLVGQCYTANVANTALTPNTMSIIATYDDASTQYVSSVNDYQSEVFPATVAASALVQGTVYTIYSSGDTNWTAVGSASNMTGVTFTALGAGSGTGTAILADANPDVIATFNTAYAANTFPGVNPVDGQTSNVSGQPNPIVIINNA